WQASCASAWPLSLPPPTMAWRDGSIEAGQTADFSRRRAPRTKLAQAGRLGGLRKLAAVGTEQEFVVMVPGLRKAKERLQKPMHRRRIKEILPADDVGNALGSIVERHAKVITGRCFLARQDHIAPDRSIDKDGAGFAGGSRAGLNPPQRSGTRCGGPHVQTQRIRFA